MTRRKRRVISLLAALVIVVGGFGVYSFLEEEKVASIVTLDVNPSIELRVDSDEDIIEVKALNSDAEKVLQGMKLKGADVDTAVNAIIGSLLKNGYIDELANSILVSVEDTDAVRGARLQEELAEEINQLLGATAINAAVLSQYMDGEKTNELSENLDISKGKAELIQSIVKVNETYEMKDLAKLSVNELNLILSNTKNEKVDVISKGTASESAYIGDEKAKTAAFAHAGVKESDVRELGIEFDYEYGKMVYEIEFDAVEYEYDYSVDAKSGEVLHSHREYNDDYVPPKEESSSEVTDIGKDKAKSVALEHAGLKESEVTSLRVEQETDDGVLEYSVEFKANGKEYDYEIAGKSGKIINYDVEKVSNTSSKNNSKESSKATTDIGKDKAKSAALSHAGLKESEVNRLHVERDVDDGRIEYSVEFHANGKEYEYEILGTTGKVLDHSVEVEDHD